MLSIAIQRVTGFAGEGLSRLAGLVLLGCLTALAQAPVRDNARWVNPFIGTGGHGHTFPGATVPFGMVQLSPDTRIDNWDGSSGYHYSDDTIYGFSHTHLSGTGIPDYCDILFMPTMGEVGRFKSPGNPSGPEWYVSGFSHENEKAEPGYYSVKLDQSGIFAELTATTRVGLHRYTFPKSGTVNVVLDLKWRDKVLDSDIKIVGKNRIEGFRRSSSWAKDQKVYFVAEFSKPFFRNLSQGGGGELEGSALARVTSYDTAKLQNIYQFEVSAGERIILKVAISPVSIEGARKNLAAELPGWNFDKVRADARAAWNKELSKVEVSGGTDAQTATFYTALYHTMIQPNIFNDVDGSYLGMDRKVHSVGARAASPRNIKDTQASSLRSGDQYTVFSLWDTFRAAHPLYTIIDQKRTVDFINTFIRQYEQGGRLPVWELAANETDCMIGYHSVSVIADAMAKGIKGFDYEKAYAAAKHSADLDHFGLAGYKKRGYISMEDENESVSRTLEYAYDDWCIAQMSKIMGQRYESWLLTVNKQLQSAEPERQYAADFQRYSARARYFENLFDQKTGFFRPKKNGGFVEPFAPNEVTFGFTEGNSWQYSFFVPQDVSRLMTLMGGREKFVAKLDELFTTEQKLAGREQADLTGLIGQYAHGNEPSHHITYLYDYAGEPWKTQKYVRHIMDDFYRPTPDGLIGNEDCGQMSAWYVMSAAGIYEVTPGSGTYSIGTPLFPELKFNLENGKTFTVRARGVSPTNFYISSATLNGAPHRKAFLTHEEMMRGGVLEFVMADAPPARGPFTEFPVSSLSTTSVAVPVINAERTFSDKNTVTLSTITPAARIYYTIDGSMPTTTSALYKEPFTISSTTTVRAIAGANVCVGKSCDQWVESQVVDAVLAKRPGDWTVRVISPYSRQYTGGGDQAIVDGIRGTTNFASGEWQGVQGKPYEAIVDLKRETEITELGASFLQVAGPWIWMPDRIEFEISSDGINFTRAAEIRPGFPQREMTPTAREYRQKISPAKARYVRLRAYNFGKIPDWHPGAGGDPWIFIDEILINPPVSAARP